jgi:hypothetical protein
MLTQIFRKEIPIQILYELLEKICIKNDNYFIVDINSYKKMIFHSYHSAFLITLKDYYHNSKKYYIEREFTYNSFTNIIRQICKSNNSQFTSKIKYNASKYNIDYLVYFDI